MSYEVLLICSLHEAAEVANVDVVEIHKVVSLFAVGFTSFLVPFLGF